MKLGEKMLASALFYADNLTPENNVFGKNPCFLRKDKARTLCSTFISLLAKEHGVTLLPKTGYAKDYYDSHLPTVGKIKSVLPGMLIIIKYAELQGGFTGHCALIAGAPIQIGVDTYLTDVVDSTSYPHGSTDPRAIGGYQGIGRGKMILLTSDGIVSGYRWSMVAPKYLNQDGARSIRIAAL